MCVREEEGRGREVKYVCEGGGGEGEKGPPDAFS